LEQLHHEAAAEENWQKAEAETSDEAVESCQLQVRDCQQLVCELSFDSN